ncbi:MULTISPECIES: MFS transporter [unclassified Cryobacterium]|uniref:MFS transporter n=1 Tax=unclassified Cryobacterium TaxID=2649013 RepID=UPI00106C52A0|nr:MULTISPECIES: MFS transporter [unclassified Cryobacterium]TFC55275.1 MFS transporter [Cryobacterium sp. TMB3-1-2]TFC71124.1 MFS transporter [Cryobacterium sp. TMB3-15]TFC77060.1 MFS transporter [Cryobacterium sp. TMB3-10]TFD46717.1 MFS transporter [Cryobacterium sp. TMB3-12]
MSTTDDIRTSDLSTAVPRAGRREWAGLVLLMLPVLLISVDNTVLSFALPAISLDLRPSSTTLLWIVDIYPLVLAGLLVAMGTLGDRVGRRKLLLIGATGFGVVSALAAFAPTAEMLIVARAVMGFFGAMIMPSTLSLLRSLFLDARQRTLAIAVWAGAFAAGSSLGPIVGGVVLQHFHWGAVFLIAVPFLLPLVALAGVLIPESKDPAPLRIDLFSVALSLLTLAPLVFAIKTLTHDGVGVLGVGALLLGLLAGAMFLRRQLRIDNPLLDLTLFQHAPFAGSVLANFLAVFSLVGFLFFVSQHLQLVLGLDPLAAGLLLLPGAVLSVVAGLASAYVVRRVPPRLVIVGGILLSAVGFGLIVLLRENLTAAVVVLAFGILSVGVGAAETISNDTILSSVPPDKAGAAAGVSETAYELGAVLGTAVLGAILAASYRASVVLPDGLGRGAAAQAGETLGGALGVAGELPAADAHALTESAKAAFDSGVGVTSIIAVVLMLIAAVAVQLSMRTRRPRG